MYKSHHAFTIPSLSSHASCSVTFISLTQVCPGDSLAAYQEKNISTCAFYIINYLFIFRLLSNWCGEGGGSITILMGFLGGAVIRNFEEKLENSGSPHCSHPHLLHSVCTVASHSNTYTLPTVPICLTETMSPYQDI